MLPTCEPRVFHMGTHVFHIKAHIFHIFSQNVINCPMWSTCISQTSTVESHVSQNSTWNTHTCTLIPHSKNYMWMHVEKKWIDSRKSTVKSRVILHSTWNAHTCTLFSHSKKNMWIHVEKFKHEHIKIYSQTPCGIIFHMKCTCLHINSTQQHQHVDACGKLWT